MPLRSGNENALPRVTLTVDDVHKGRVEPGASVECVKRMRRALATGTAVKDTGSAQRRDSRYLRRSTGVERAWRWIQADICCVDGSVQFNNAHIDVSAQQKGDIDHHTSTVGYISAEAQIHDSLEYRRILNLTSYVARDESFDVWRRMHRLYGLLSVSHLQCLPICVFQGGILSVLLPSEGVAQKDDRAGHSSRRLGYRLPAKQKALRHWFVIPASQRKLVSLATWK
ncbi:hypothetical protein BDZ89DRAFT_1112427 [Hymenopellis radicata]|nr:hypothetical protein BDZ89DRAFT_1112427 [Hymenopellis radicata]